MFALTAQQDAVGFVSLRGVWCVAFRLAVTALDRSSATVPAYAQTPYARLIAAPCNGYRSRVLAMYGVRSQVRWARLANYFRPYGNSAYGFQPYLSLVNNVQLRKCLSRFRCSNHCLEVETGRRGKPLKTPICERLCKQCSLGAVEDEDNFLLICPAYEHIRDRFRQHLPIGPITSVQEMVSCQNQSAFARFIEHCLQIRTQ